MERNHSIAPYEIGNITCQENRYTFIAGVFHPATDCRNWQTAILYIAWNKQVNYTHRNFQRQFRVAYQHLTKGIRCAAIKATREGEQVGYM